MHARPIERTRDPRESGARDHALVQEAIASGRIAARKGVCATGARADAGVCFHHTMLLVR
jgi:hypothetical protein